MHSAESKSSSHGLKSATASPRQKVLSCGAGSWEGWNEPSRGVKYLMMSRVPIQTLAVMLMLAAAARGDDRETLTTLLQAKGPPGRTIVIPPGDYQLDGI